VHNDVKSRLRYLPNTPKQTTEDTHVTQNLRHHLLLSTDVPQTLDTINTSFVTTHFLFSYMDFTHLIFSYLHDLLSTLHHFCLELSKLRDTTIHNSEKLLDPKSFLSQLSRLRMALLVRFHQVCVLFSCPLLFYIFFLYGICWLIIIGF